MKKIFSKTSLIISTIVLTLTTINLASHVLADKKDNLEQVSLVAIKNLTPAKNETVRALEGVCFTSVGNLPELSVQVDNQELVPNVVEKNENGYLICADAGEVTGILGLTKISVLSGDKGLVYYVYVSGK